ncbi:unnamed protein product [Albugo candida]|uniref:Uncharacterized protein n=1 Tax=Albugo candida TaxID=65357 RepID=A0A024FTW3_9STRA|nr:unnamed protein product [Albugo candida]|eukprot:CCI10578.1 unnamed protein product [Albugo candida]
MVPLLADTIESWSTCQDFFILPLAPISPFTSSINSSSLVIASLAPNPATAPSSSAWDVSAFEQLDMLVLSRWTVDLSRERKSYLIGGQYRSEYLFFIYPKELYFHVIKIDINRFIVSFSASANRKYRYIDKEIVLCYTFFRPQISVFRSIFLMVT